MIGLNCWLNPIESQNLVGPFPLPCCGLLPFQNLPFVNTLVALAFLSKSPQHPLKISPHACRLRLRLAPLLACILLSSRVDGSQFMEVAQSTPFKILPTARWTSTVCRH